MEEEQPLKRVKTEIILDKNADLINRAKNKIGNVDTETLRVLSIPRLLGVFDAQFLHTLFDDFCDCLRSNQRSHLEDRVKIWCWITRSPQSFEFLDYSRVLREIFWFIDENASWASDTYITILLVNIIKQAPMKSQNTITTLMQNIKPDAFIEVAYLLSENMPSELQSTYFQPLLPTFLKYIKSNYCESAIECFDLCNPSFDEFNETEKGQIWDAVFAALPASASFLYDGAIHYTTTFPWNNWKDWTRVEALINKASKAITVGKPIYKADYARVLNWVCKKNYFNNKEIKMKVKQMRQLHIKEALQVPLKYKLSSLKQTCMYAVVNQNIGKSLLPLDLTAEIDTYQTQDVEYRIDLLAELSICFTPEDTTMQAEFEPIIDYFLSVPFMDAHPLIITQYSIVVADSEITNEQTFCKAVKLLNYCLASTAKIDENETLYNLVSTVRDMMIHSIDSQEWNNTLSVLMGIPSQRLCMEELAYIYTDLVTIETSEEIIKEVIRRIKERLRLWREEEVFTAVGAFLSRLCSDEYYNVAQNCMHDICDLAYYFDTEDFYFDEMYDMMRTVIKRIGGTWNQDFGSVLEAFLTNN